MFLDHGVSSGMVYGVKRALREGRPVEWATLVDPDQPEASATRLQALMQDPNIKGLVDMYESEKRVHDPKEEAVALPSGFAGDTIPAPAVDDTAFGDEPFVATKLRLTDAVANTGMSLRVVGFVDAENGEKEIQVRFSDRARQESYTEGLGEHLMHKSDAELKARNGHADVSIHRASQTVAAMGVWKDEGSTFEIAQWVWKDSRSQKHQDGFEPLRLKQIRVNTDVQEEKTSSDPMSPLKSRQLAESLVGKVLSGSEHSPADKLWARKAKDVFVDLDRDTDKMTLEAVNRVCGSAARRWPVSQENASVPGVQREFTNLHAATSLLKSKGQDISKKKERSER